jgi:hypothetical protein
MKNIIIVITLKISNMNGKLIVGVFYTLYKNLMFLGDLWKFLKALL